MLSEDQKKLLEAAKNDPNELKAILDELGIDMVDEEIESQEPTNEPGDGLPDDPAELKKMISDLRKEAGNYRTKANKLETEKAEAEKAALEEKGEYKELYEAEAASKKELQAQLEDISGKYGTIEQARRTELLQKLPEDKRANYESLDLNVLDTIVKDFSEGQVPENSPGAGKLGGTQKLDPASLSEAEWAELYKSDPEMADKLVTQMAHKQMGLEKKQE